MLSSVDVDMEQTVSRQLTHSYDLEVKEYYFLCHNLQCPIFPSLSLASLLLPLISISAYATSENANTLSTDDVDRVLRLVWSNVERIYGLDIREESPLNNPR